MAILKGPVNPVTTGTTTFPDLKSVQVTAPNRHSVRPSLVLDFANARTMDPRITFTRGSNATYYDGSSAIVEQNLLVRSQDWTSSWGLNSSATTFTANSTTAPDGTTTATQISVARTNNEIKYTEQSVAGLSGPVTVSAYFKANTWNFLNLAVYQAGFTDACAIAFNLSTGAITKTTSNGSASVISSSITSFGNGWYRVVLTASFPSTAATYLILSSNSVSVPTYNYQSLLEAYAGTVGNSFYVWGAQMEQRANASAYTPTTTTPITNYIPVLATAGANQPRFDIDPITKESKGLLVEDQKTNLVLNSGNFSGWIATYATILQNAAIAPDGTNTACKIRENTGVTGWQGCYYRVITPGAGNYTASVFMKAGERRYGTLRLSTDGDSKRYLVTIDLQTGLVASTYSDTSPVNTSYSITNCGNGWYRLAVTAYSAASDVYITPVAADSANPNYNSGFGSLPGYVGNGYSGIYIWGGQIEAGGFSTSYIPTGASTVTRATDVAVITGGNNFTGWFNPIEGSIFADVSSPLAPITAGNFGGILAITDSGFSNVTISMGVAGSTGLLQHEQYVLGNTKILNSYNIANRTFKTAFAYDATNASGNVAGGTVSTATTSYSTPIVDRLRIGTERTGGAMINGTIKKISYYPKRLSSAELISLTTA